MFINRANNKPLGNDAAVADLMRLEHAFEKYGTQGFYEQVRKIASGIREE